MKIVERFFNDVLLLEPKVIRDHRGFFMESYNQKTMTDLGINTHFVQDNHSYTQQKDVIRGLHFQSPPMGQTKLVRVLEGRVLDVVVDLRPNSPTYKHHCKVELSSENMLYFYIPSGFAHGFCTLSENCHLFYKVDNHYSVECNNGISWNDPDLAIDWGVKNPILSEQDAKWCALSETKSGF